MAALSAAPPCMPLKPCQRSLRNAVVPPRTPGCDTTFTIRAWSLRAVGRSESAPVSVTTAVICLLSSGGWPNSLVMQDQMDVSTLSRRVMSPVGSTLIHSITEWPSLLPSSPSRTSIGLPYGLLSLTGDVRGCHVPSQSHTDGLGALCPPVAWDAHDKEARSPCTRYSALLAQACQHLWLVFCDDVYRAFTWVRPTIHPSPSPPDAGRYIVPSRFRCQPVGCGCIVRRRCTS